MYQIKEGLEKDYEQYKGNNTDMYSAGIVRYADAWGTLMDAKLAAGEAIPDMAEKSEREADTEGITGFMYGCAVSELARFWAHGDTLRRWHNLKTQIGNEGERANESGGILNPSLLSIGTNS